MNDLNEKVRGFFNHDIGKMIVPDLQRLRREIRPDRSGLAGCTVPTAMFAFAVLDLVGYLTREDPNARRDQTEKNIQHALSRFSPLEYSRYADLLIKLVRHGIVHQALPKAAGIAKADAARLVTFGSRGIPGVNVDRLVDDLLEVLGALETEVRSAPNGQLARRMKCRVEELQKTDAELGSKIMKIAKAGP